MSHIIEPLTKLYMKYRPGAKIARILFSLKTEGHKALAHGLSRTFGQKICSIFKTVFELIVVSYNFFLSDHVFFFCRVPFLEIPYCMRSRVDNLDMA